MSYALQMIAFYVAVNALIMFVLAFRAASFRGATKIFLGDDNNPQMRQRMRAHGNNAEYVPMALLLIFAIHALGGSIWLIHAVGASLTLGRIAHGYGVSTSSTTNPFRMWGTVLTWLSFLVGIVAVLWLAFAG